MMHMRLAYFLALLSLFSGCGRENPAVTPIRGNINGETLVQFTDFDCSGCKAVQPSVHALRISHPQIGIAFKSFPLSDTDAGIWKHLIGRCIFNQDRDSFWLYYDLMFSAEAPAVVKADSMAELLGLEARELSACAARAETKQAVLRDLEEGRKRGARGTPSFFFNGRMIEGYQTPEKMRQFVDDLRG